MYNIDTCDYTWRTNMYSEEKIELRDIDECIKERKELIEEVKQLEEVTSSNEILRKINTLKKRWKKMYCISS